MSISGARYSAVPQNELASSFLLSFLPNQSQQEIDILYKYDVLTQ